MGQTQQRKYEEYAYVLDFKSRSKSTTVRGRTGIIVIAIGEERLTLLEILGIENSTFDIGERIYIGKEGRTKVQSVLGKINPNKIATTNESAPSSKEVRKACAINSFTVHPTYLKEGPRLPWKRFSMK